MIPMDTPVFTTSEACKYLKISRPMLLKLINEGKIKSIRIGKRGDYRILKSELDRFLTNFDNSKEK